MGKVANTHKIWANKDPNKVHPSNPLKESWGVKPWNEKVKTTGEKQVFTKAQNKRLSS